MQFLPIVQRELRAAAHQPRTWWRRVLSLAVALVFFLFLLLTMGQRLGLSFIGMQLFAVLSFFGAIYALLAGPLATADCLSRERREGTLGLLFLTDLQSYDVVLGKMASASLNIFFDLIAALPVVTLPVLMGGVSLGRLGFTAIALLDIMFLSLALGTCASAFVRSGRSSLAVTLAALLFLMFGPPLIGEEILGLGLRSPAGPWVYMLCPLQAMVNYIGPTMRGSWWGYWLNIGGMHALGWTFLLIASWRTANSWRELPVSARVQRWRKRLECWRKGSAAARRAWRSSMLDRNPVSWLEGRDRLQARMLRAILLGVGISGALTHVLSPAKWPTKVWIILWPFLAHYTLGLWIAIQAPRRLADDKESGALELLLCTPVTPADIVRGCMRILRRWFGSALLALLMLDVLFGWAYFSEHGGWAGLQQMVFPEFTACVLAVTPVQAYTLARMGLYQGLVATTSLRATFMLIWKVCVLPWPVFAAFMLGLETTQRYVGLPFRVTDRFGFGALASVHLLLCALFLARANWQLRSRFRSLAAQPAGAAKWPRWLRPDKFRGNPH
jgi:ABC-type transport system involved in cytochrome c biogenesis permease component